MVRFLKKRWYASQALAVLQTYYEQPLRKPLPPFEKGLLDGAVNLTLNDGGTPFDAATRFYAAFAETAVRNGQDLESINFGVVLGRLLALRDQMKFFDEHKTALQSVRNHKVNLPTRPTT